MNVLARFEGTEEEVSGGYTKFNGALYTLQSRYTANTYVLQGQRIIIGVDYGSQGEELGLNGFETFQMIQDAFNGTPVAITLGCGAWLNPEDNQVIKELVAIVTPTGESAFPDWKLAVTAERLRLAFRQSSVLMVLSTNQAVFVKG